MTEENTNPEAETVAPAADPSLLSVADLKMMARIIQVGSQRGSFKAEEMITVGGLYEKIIGFLRDAGQLDPAPTPEAPAAEPTMMPEETEGSTPSDETEENK